MTAWLKSHLPRLTSVYYNIKDLKFLYVHLFRKYNINKQQRRMFLYYRKAYRQFYMPWKKHAKTVALTREVHRNIGKSFLICLFAVTYDVNIGVISYRDKEKMELMGMEEFKKKPNVMVLAEFVENFDRGYFDSCVIIDIRGSEKSCKKMEDSILRRFNCAIVGNICAYKENEKQEVRSKV